MDYPTHKNVNGVNIQLTPEEAEAIWNEWQKNRFPERVKTIKELVNELDEKTVAKLKDTAKEWAEEQEDVFIQFLANSSDQDTLLVATWLRNNPQGAMAKGVNFRGMTR